MSNSEQAVREKYAIPEECALTMAALEHACRECRFARRRR